MSNEYKGFLIVAGTTFMLHTIKPVGRGSVPLELRGQYTSRVFAERDIDRYLGSKEKMNAKAASTS